MKSILLVRNDRLGDLMLSLPAGEALRKAWPHCRISYLAAEGHAELLMALPWVHSVIEDVPSRGVGSIAAEIRALSPEAVLFLYPRPKTAWAAWRAGVPLRVGPLGRWYFPLFNRRLNIHRSRYERHEADYNLDLVRSLGVEAELRQAEVRVSGAPQDRVSKLLADRGWAGKKNIILLHPGSGGSSPTWTPEKFAEAAKGLLSRGFLVGSTAGPGEEARAQAASGGDGAVFSGLSLPELSALFSRAALVIAGSTGTLHLASASGAKILGLYSALPASTPKRWAPLGPGRVLVAKRREDVFLETITVADVLDAVSGILN